MWRGRKPMWEIWAVIQNLPPGSALNRKVDPDQWRLEHHMTADLYDIAALVGGVTEDSDSKTPVRYPRPGDAAPPVAKKKTQGDKVRESAERFAIELAAGGDV